MSLNSETATAVGNAEFISQIVEYNNVKVTKHIATNNADAEQSNLDDKSSVNATNTVAMVNRELPPPVRRGKDISKFSDDALKTILQRYDFYDITEGSAFNKAEIVTEQARRMSGEHNGEVLFEQIVRLALESPDRLTTYKQIWALFEPDDPWQHHVSLARVMAALGLCIEYCVRNNLPIMTVMCVRTIDRKLDDRAVCNIYNSVLALDQRIDESPDAFVRQQTFLCRAFINNIAATRH